VLLAWTVLGLAGVEAAQAQTPESRSRVLVAGGFSTTGAMALGSGDAALTPNTGSSATSLFTASAEMGQAAGFEVRAGYRVSRTIVASAVTALASGDVNVDVSGDFEGAPPVRFAGERLTLWTVEGRVDVEIPPWAFAGGRVVPYVMASGGYRREAHESRAVVESGQIYQAGGGVAWSLRRQPASRLSSVGLTVETRLAHVRGGFHWGREARTAPVFAVGILTGWGRR
jgi:hypothetical protein